MTTKSTILTIPVTLDAARVDMMRQDLVAALKSVDVSPFSDPLMDHLAAIMAHSTYLARLIRTRPKTVATLYQSHRTGPQDHWDYTACEADFDMARASALTSAANAATAGNMTALMAQLRHAKADLALCLALADLCGMWSMRTVTKCLSDLADTAVQAAASYLLRAAHDKGDLALPDPANPTAQSGLVILAMGKLGAQELNYSSDIDLIVLYDQKIAKYQGRKTPAEFFVRLTRDLVKAISEMTADGYVFRTDLRLRPDAAMTPLAMPIDAAISYYESTGLNWERAAMIKARAIGGDIDSGKHFIAEIRPFVWRRALDFAAIDDVQDMTNKIRRQHGTGPLSLTGHNVKLGRGGIREIEFFVQTYQMILGGRNRRLRLLPTLDVLDALKTEEVITAETCDQLSHAYIFLREVEHRLQMLNDEQTQTLPKQQDALTGFAAFCGFADFDDFATAFSSHDRTVRTAYDTLLEISYASSAETRLATTSDPAPIDNDNLRKLGYDRPDDARVIITKWQTAPYKALKSDRARLLAKDLAPTILQAFAKADDPNFALLRFDEFLSGLPTGVQFFSLIRSHPWVLEELALLINASPRLSRQLERRPSLLDVFIDGHILDLLDHKDDASADLQFRLDAAASYEEKLDIARQWKNELEFLIAARHLSGRLSSQAAIENLTALADTVIMTMKPIVEHEFANKHGYVKGGQLAIIALGRLGERQMTPQSDLDLIFVFKADQDAPQSDGDKPLTTGLYFHRLTQRIINAISALTAEGQLYEVDMRMRPQGKKGPIASSLESFTNYYKNDAWIFERQALTKARLIGVEDAFAGQLHAVIDAAIHDHQIPADEIYAQIGLMRQRMAKAAGAVHAADIKRARGGLIDLEFMEQAKILTGHLPRDLSDHERSMTQDAHQFYHDLLLTMRSNEEPAQLKTDPIGTMPVQLLENLCAIIGIDVADRHKARFGALENRIENTRNNVRALFDSLFEKRIETDAENTPTLDDLPPSD